MLQFDFYHAQIMTGDLARSFERHLPIIGHVQIAGVPERHEPDVGEINYPYLFDLIDRLGYAGWVGCEYFPAGSAEAGLGWAYRYGIAPKSTLSRPAASASERRKSPPGCAGSTRQGGGAGRGPRWALGRGVRRRYIGAGFE